MEEHIWKSEGVSTPLGRVMNALLDSRPRHLEAAISRLSSDSQRSSGVLLDESLRYIQRYTRDAIDKGEPLDQILIPLIENSVKSKSSKHSKQVLMLLTWLFQDELVFQHLSSALLEIIVRKEDRYIALGWCTLIRGLLDHGLNMGQSSDSGKQEKHYTLLKILSRSMSHLSSIICDGSTVQDGFELPTRLSLSAADCTIAFTEALTRKASLSKVSNGIKKSSESATNQLITFVPTESKEKASRPSKVLEDMEMEWLLWDHLAELIILVQKLQAWSRKSRPLHAKGLDLILKWLQDIRRQYGSLKDEAGGTLNVGVMLLSSCWKHYVMLLRLEDPRFSQNYMELVDQYISAIQFYTENDTDKHPGNMSHGMETIKFFLNCISLLVGRLDKKQFENAVCESGLQTSNFLLSLLHCTDEDVIDGAVSILRALIFQPNFPLIKSSHLDLQQMESVFPLLLNLLDERDSIAKAVVLLTAEFCFLNPDGQCLKEIFIRLDSGNRCQRWNAIDVILELIHVSSDSGKAFTLSVREDIAQHMLDRLGDEDPAIRVRVSNIFSQIDPHLVLPALVRLVYPLDDQVQSSALDAILVVLKYHNQKVDLILMLLDCLSNLSQSPELQKTPRQRGAHSSSKTSQAGSKFDPDRVLQLIPRWAETVHNWSILIEPLIDKMFADPSNAITVRFLSYISEHLAESGDVVLRRVLFHSNGHKEMDQNQLLKSENETFTSDNSLSLKGSLFSHLCPLLIIRLLPLELFNNLNSSVMYGRLLNEGILHENRDASDNDHGCIASLILYRAFHLFEFEDVCKLAAELCGRLHPQVLLPIVESQLENAAHNRDILKLKACLFSVCTSLAIRGKDSALHPVMNNIRKILEMILLWPSLDGDEVSKAQHGCIDCLALMICAELQALQSSKDSDWSKPSVVEGTVAVGSVLAYIIQRLTCDGHADTALPTEPLLPLSFRLCMANVLISTCQKISSSAKPLFARRMLPALIHSIEIIADSEVRAACLQVLFSAVYHLKSTVLPYSLDLLKLSIKGLRKGSEKEKIACAKLMASLMACEDSVVESLSSGLLEAKSALAAISSAECSPELQQLCRKLLSCITSPLDDVLRHLSTSYE
ncbi:hypothetical protein MRB53_012292 [Persea americana]|uniref:Uncharacterized protein n=1 Tax=Persea americana TaxID=3435 RepID=A0ACC2LX89_PERAE|nr:hypothetical protein MRB53_012292 [Persea americana]